MTDEEFDDRVRSAISAAIRYVDDTQSPNWTGAVESALGSIRKSVELLRSAPTGETEPPRWEQWLRFAGNEEAGSPAKDWRVERTTPEPIDGRAVWPEFDTEGNVAGVGVALWHYSQRPLFYVEPIGASASEWPCGCKPFSSNSADYCEEHQLTLGSIEQRIGATRAYLERLGASAGSGEPRFTQEDVAQLRDAYDFEPNWPAFPSLADRIEKSLATPGPRAEDGGRVEGAVSGWNNTAEGKRYVTVLLDQRSTAVLEGTELGMPATLILHPITPDGDTES